MLDRYLFKHVGRAKSYIANSVIMMMLRTVGTEMIALSFGILIDSLYFERNVNVLKIMILLLLGIFIRVFSLFKVTKYQSNIIGEVKARLRKKLISKAMSVGTGYSEKISTSDLINMGSDTIEQLENYYGRFLPEYYGCYGISLVNFAIFLYIDWHVAILFLILMPIIPLFLRFMLTMVDRMQKKYWKRYQDVGALFLDSLQGITALKIFKADEKRADELDKKSEDFRKETMKILAMQLNSITIIEWIAYGSSIAGILMYFFSKNNSSILFPVMLLVLAIEAFRPMITLTSSFHVAMTGVAAGKKLIEFLELEEDKREGKFPYRDLEKFEVKELGFSYQDSEKPALKDINMSILSKGYVAIVGESGCGKSTLAKILSGTIRANSGNVYVNDKSYDEINSASIAKNVVRITHNSHIFEGSVYENLVMAGEDISEEDIKKVLERVNLYDEIIARGGLEMQLSSGGLNLSGGQRQRLALARAMLHNPKVYIFDEATSNIDIESENIILDSIKEIAEEKPVIIVSHRISSIKDADRIYVMNTGKIVEEGNHSGLMNINGEYKKIYEAQNVLEGGF